MDLLHHFTTLFGGLIIFLFVLDVQKSQCKSIKEMRHMRSIIEKMEKNQIEERKNPKQDS